MVLQAEPTKTGESVTAEQLHITRGIIEKRAVEMGASSVTVQVSDDGKLTVVLTSVSDVEAATKGIVGRGFVELVDGGDNPPLEGSLVVTELGGPPPGGPQPEDRTIWRVVATSDDMDLSKMSVEYGTMNQPLVAFTLTGEGTKKFADFTASNINKFLPILLDKKVISAPQIQGAIIGGSGVITGLTLDEARTLVAQLKAGVLPVNLRLLESTVTKP